MGQTNILLSYGYVDTEPLDPYESFHISAQEVLDSYTEVPFYDQEVVYHLEKKHRAINKKDCNNVFFEIYTTFLECTFSQFLTLLVKPAAFVNENCNAPDIPLNTKEKHDLVHLKFCVFANFIQPLKLNLGNLFAQLFQISQFKF